MGEFRLKALLAIALLAAGSALAGEFAVLSNGNLIAVERHEVSGETVCLYSKDGGITQLPASEISGFKPDDSVPKPAPAVAPAAPAAVDPKLVIDRAARKWGLEPKVLHSVAKAESAYRPDAVSLKGAIGVMQLMPQTARELGADPHNLEQNVDAGARYLRDLLLKYDNSLNKAVAAYNAGPAAVDRYRGIPPYSETVKYVERVVRDYLRKGN